MRGNGTFEKQTGRLTIEAIALAATKIKVQRDRKTGLDRVDLKDKIIISVRQPTTPSKLKLKNLRVKCTEIFYQYYFCWKYIV
jgi:hypothetical protein